MCVPRRHSKVDRRLLLAVYALLGSVVNVLIPLGRNYLYLLVLFTLQGVTKALCDVGEREGGGGGGGRARERALASHLVLSMRNVTTQTRP